MRRGLQRRLRGGVCGAVWHWVWPLIFLVCMTCRQKAVFLYSPACND
jgi:hypothetical protein